MASSQLLAFENTKFCIDKDRPISYLRSILVNKLNLEEHKVGFYLFCGKYMIHDGQNKIGDIYGKYKD